MTGRQLGGLGQGPQARLTDSAVAAAPNTAGSEKLEIFDHIVTAKKNNSLLFGWISILKGQKVCCTALNPYFSCQDNLSNIWNLTIMFMPFLF